MKKNYLFIALVMMLMAGFTACSNDDDKNDTTNPAPEPENPAPEPENPAKRGLTDTDTKTTGVFEMTAAQQAAVTPLNDFSINLFREVSTQVGADNSTVVSPLSVAIVLGMLNEGASGNTCGEIQKALGLTDKTKDDINLLMSKIVKGVSAIDQSVAVSLANNITVNNMYKLLPQYEKVMADYYQASAYSLNFSDPTATNTINNWCYEHTNGVIPKIIDMISPSAVAYLLDAVYFKGGWTTPFDKAASTPQWFAGRGIELIRMACRRGQEKYYENTTFQALQLPLGNGSYSMTILLPLKKDGLQDMLKQLNGNVISQLDFKEYDVKTTLPIFRTENEIKLIPILKSLGVVDAFGPNAKFPDMIQNVTDELYVSNMWQRASLGIDEEGCEGAAITIAIMEVTCGGEEGQPKNTDYPQRYFTADHPFLYLISDQETGAIFFIGQFCGR